MIMRGDRGRSLPGRRGDRPLALSPLSPARPAREPGRSCMEGQVMTSLRSGRAFRCSRPAIVARGSAWRRPRSAAAWPAQRAGPGREPDGDQVLSRLQRHRRRPAAERRQPRPRRAVGRGDRDLSAGDPAVRRQGRQAAQGRPGGRPAGRVGPVRRPPPVLPAAARRAAARGPGALPGRVDAQAERWYRQGAADARPGAARGGSSSRRSAARGATTRSTCSATWRSRTAGSTRRCRRTASSSPTGPATRSGLVHPDPSVDLARVAAKKLLCRAALGDDPPDAGRPRGVRRRRIPEPRARSPAATGRYLDDARRGARRRPPRPAAAARRPLADLRRRRRRGPRSSPGPIDVGSLQWRVDLDPIDAEHAALPRDEAGGWACRSAPIPEDRALPITRSSWATR